MSATPDGNGYRFVASDGGVFDFGDATFQGSAPAAGGVVGMATAGSNGYWLAGSGGTVESFGKAASFAALKAAAGPYVFEESNADGSPARWNPCQAIPYVVNATEAPPGALSMIAAALAQVTAATGMQFVYAGPSNELASRERSLTAGGRWNPVLFVWEQPGQSDYLPAGGGEDGMGGYTAVSNSSGLWVVVSGQVALAADAGSIPGFASAGGWEHLLLHEIGHVVGLGHVNDSAQVMYPYAGPGAAVAYGSGDLAGMRLLGSTEGCLIEPSTAGF
ncbi:MAG TPA: matrixin family metalloprotease, partial [Acidimicrobiales bacterium]|nr:matrixin family metalloprotease [Acidimicrobiales bacterium]